MTNSYNSEIIKEIQDIYSSIKKDIENRLEEFTKLWENETEENLFSELAFCLLTPQSKAKMCWSSICTLKETNALVSGNEEQVLACLYGVRFKYKKAKYIIQVRELFKIDGKLSVKKIIEGNNSPYEIREWLVKNVKGMGYKEASHFLRNIGKGKDIAILDRHILKNLRLIGVIEKIPESITPSKYIELENIMREFTKEIEIPLDHLDIVLWYKETGEIFK
ncbi:MAG: N-glycosylase/DNA lyase [Candidatus Methanofastidiosum methylothiophilum]|uniref:8-oxoguanine DNA glycosylase/AP lyase n=1 Tax=Candidatus Methanofastidiosum methylothiophilum TaxID=1705564 RepID=A0A150J8E3_9EURY|nr:MAG: N-glycosylase/DNA lyase [Candidatus Methanofastidiosum methylthiophilus]NMC76252.1 N-glycosylase/DNA lyase [Candidatus Methanofastidiosa archaeon]